MSLWPAWKSFGAAAKAAETASQTKAIFSISRGDGLPTRRAHSRLSCATLARHRARSFARRAPRGVARPQQQESALGPDQFNRGVENAVGQQFRPRRARHLLVQFKDLVQRLARLVFRLPGGGRVALEESKHGWW
jgi:hypothetical protein